MIDLEHHYGRDFKLVGYDNIMRVLDRNRVEVSEGDLVCVSGPVWSNLFTRAGVTGVFRTGSRTMAFVAPIEAVEASPSRTSSQASRSSLPLHAHRLFRFGVYVGEFWDFAALANWLRRNNRSRFLLTARR